MLDGEWKKIGKKQGIEWMGLEKRGQKGGETSGIVYTIIFCFWIWVRGFLREG